MVVLITVMKGANVDEIILENSLCMRRLRFNREIMTMIMVKTMWRDIRAMTLMLGLHW